MFLATQDRIIIVDPMGEYAPLVQRLSGEVIEIAPDSPHHINPMDIKMDTADGESPLSMKADFLLSLCEWILGGKEGLQPIDRTQNAVIRKARGYPEPKLAHYRG